MSDKNANPTTNDLDEASFREAMSQVDEEPVGFNQRVFSGGRMWAVAVACVAYSVFHLYVMNIYPLETWAYRLSHIGGGLALGFLIYAAGPTSSEGARQRSFLSDCVLAVAAVGIILGFAMFMAIWNNVIQTGVPVAPEWALRLYGIPMFAGACLAVAHGWFFADRRQKPCVDGRSFADRGRIQRDRLPHPVLATTAAARGAFPWRFRPTCGRQSPAYC